jgi:DNA-binding FadR family transcriptional regulator
VTHRAIGPLGLRASSVSVHIAAHLERLITIGEFSAGEKFPAERDLAADLQVSRASLREAMHELEAKKLIDRRPGRGTIVLPPPEHVRDLYQQISGEEHKLRDVAELRETIEPQIARLAACRATEANLIELDGVLQHTVEGLNVDGSVKLDLEFHLLLAQASQNPLLASLNTLASSWTLPVRKLSHATKHAREVSYRGHRAILDAVVAGDKNAAGETMLKHLQEVAELTNQNCLL